MLPWRNPFSDVESDGPDLSRTFEAGHLCKHALHWQAEHCLALNEAVWVC